MHQALGTWQVEVPHKLFTLNGGKLFQLFYCTSGSCSKSTQCVNKDLFLVGEGLGQG
jgi:hypothetical protein